MAGTPIYKAVMREKNEGLDMGEEFDSYGYHPGENFSDFDVQWSIDAALMDNYFYEPEILNEVLKPDEIYYKGKSGAVFQIVSTSALTREELQAARNELEIEVRAAGFSY
jgi:hypothetical protein